jgi:hypothetical protein
MHLVINNTNAEPRMERWYVKEGRSRSSPFIPDTSEFMQDRYLVRRLAERFGDLLAIHHTTDLLDLAALLDRIAPQTVAVVTNFPFNLDRIPDGHLSVQLLTGPIEGGVDLYADTKARIHGLLATHPNLKLLVITGASKNTLPDPDILCLGKPNQVVVRRKRDLGYPWGSSDGQKAILELVTDFATGHIAETGHASRPSLHKPSQGEKPPRYWYEPGDILTVDSKIPAIPGQENFRLLDSVDAEFGETERRLCETIHLDHSTFNFRPAVVPRQSCSYCGQPMTRLVNTYWITENCSTNSSSAFCHFCGWWLLRGEERNHFMDNNEVGIGDRILQFGRMKEFDLKDIALPVSVAADAVAADPRASSHIHPRRFEEIVAYALSSFFSCRIELTKTTRDGGYDILGFDSEKGKFLVEVKRKGLDTPARRIGVSAVRALGGALIQHNTPHGMLVTNATFSSDAIAAASSMTAHGWQIELKDIDDLCDWLAIFRKGHRPAAALDQGGVERRVLLFQCYMGHLQMEWDYMKYVPALNQGLFEF